VPRDPFSLQIYTPNNDLAAGFNPSQIIAGRSGNDAYVTALPNETQNTQQELRLDIFIGDVAIDDPQFRQWQDKFILGDWQSSYYANGNPNNFGVNNFGAILDFNPALDTIELYGTSDNYSLLDVGVGTALIQQQQGFDLVGFLVGNSNLNLNSSYFQYQGFTPPPVAQPQIKQLGTSGFDIGAATATDTFGNVYVAGGSTGSLGDTNAGLRDGLVAKYDSLGNLLNTIQVGTTEFDTIYGIDTDQQGNFYVAGITEGNLAEPRQSDTSDAFVAKYNSDGELQWIDQFGENLIFQTFNIDVDQNGNAHLTGINVKPSEVDIATDDFWTAKYDTNGNRQWFTEVGSSDNAFDESYTVAVDENDGSVYTGGWTLGDLAQPNEGAYDAWVTKLNENGVVQWIRQLGTPDYERTVGVDTDSQGNVYATGWTLGDLLGTGKPGSFDNWLAKFDSLGNILWLEQFGTAGEDEPFDLFIDTNDNIFLTGYTNSNLGGQNAGSFDAWAALFDTEGNQQWIQQFGTSTWDQAYALTGDNNGSLYITGVTQGSLGNINAGSFDAWVAKLNAATGQLLEFNNTPELSTNSLLAENLLAIEADTGKLSQEQIEYITKYLNTFTKDRLGLSPGDGGPSGKGLEKFIANGYGPVASVPEPSSAVGLLMFGAVSMIGAKKVKRRLNSRGLMSSTTFQGRFNKGRSIKNRLRTKAAMLKQSVFNKGHNIESRFKTKASRARGYASKVKSWCKQVFA
jgi:hypothetical protein